MGNIKNKVKKCLNEANFMVKKDDVDDIINKIKKDDVVKIVDEDKGGENNPWAICKAQQQKSKTMSDADVESCIQKLKKQHHLSEDGETDITNNNGEKRDVPKLKQDVQKFLDKLNLTQFENILAKIDQPIEQVELIAAFAERIGVPRAKLPLIMSNLKQTSESINPKMSKDKLIETVKSINEKKVIKQIKIKDIKNERL